MPTFGGVSMHELLGSILLPRWDRAPLVYAGTAVLGILIALVLNKVRQVAVQRNEVHWHCPDQQMLWAGGLSPGHVAHRRGLALWMELWKCSVAQYHNHIQFCTCSSTTPWPCLPPCTSTHLCSSRSPGEVGKPARPYQVSLAMI